MAVPTIDGRKMWLDESQIHAHNFLAKMLEMAEKRTLSAQEKNLKQMSASFLYLYDRAMQAGLLDDPDELMDFLNETIH